MKRHYSAIFLLFVAFYSFGQVPVVSDFSPTSGPVGTTVTISGSNFSTTASDNIVYFGSVKAFVTNALSNALTVTVPPGSSYRPISVTVAGLTAYSTRIFNITFPQGGFIEPGSFGNPLQYSATQSTKIAIGDLDGDRKSDVAVVGYDGISIFRNIGTNSVVAFSPRVDFPVGANTSDITMGDLDGDGKLDLVLSIESSSKVSILRNICSPGSITTNSFEPMVDFAVERWPMDVSIKDLDGDGKPDLAVATELAQISILRNTSTVGAITTSSFASMVNIPVGPESLRLATTDLDGDGKPELIASSNTSASISVLRNLCSPGSITTGSFASKVDFATGNSPCAIITADMDGDSKNDIVVSNLGSNTFSVLKNTSTLGAITTSSFAAKVDFATDPGPFYMDVADVDGDGKPDLCMTRSYNNSSFSIHRNITPSGTISTGSFQPGVNVAISGTGVSFGDFNNDGKPDVAVTSDQLSILPNILGYCVISDFSPMAGEEGTVVTINGHNFDPIPSNNIVKFDGVTAAISAGTTTSLVATVPAGATNGFITVEVNGLASQSPSAFVVPPVITSFTPSSGPGGSTVVISGLNFDPLPSNNAVEFNGSTAVVSESTPTRLTVTVPPNATSGLIKVSVNSFLVTSTSAFEIKENQSITFNGIAGIKTLGDLPFALDAIATSGLPVQFSATSSKISISGNQATLLAPGSVTVTANQSGNDMFSPAPPVTQTFCIHPMKPRVSIESADNGMPLLVSTSSAGNQWYYNGVAVAGETSSSLLVSETGFYNVKVTIDECVSQMSDDAEVTVTGTEDAYNQTIVLYPIPADRLLSLEFNGFDNARPIDIEIYSSLAVKVDHRKIESRQQNVELDISKLSQGIYTLSARQDGIVHQIRFVKKN